ncbi:MAG: hypothetical protein WAM39_20705 [Bryobacteraceae bacterium]
MDGTELREQDRADRGLDVFLDDLLIPPVRLSGNVGLGIGGKSAIKIGANGFFGGFDIVPSSM